MIAEIHHIMRYKVTVEEYHELERVACRECITPIMELPIRALVRTYGIDLQIRSGYGGVSAEFEPPWSSNNTVKMVFYVTDEEYKRIKKIAIKYDMSIQRLVRSAITEAFGVKFLSRDKYGRLSCKTN